MSIKLNPYLMFDGTAAKAIQLYERALGVRADRVQRFGEVPGSQTSSEHKDRIIHAQLHLGQGLIMVSDSQPGVPVTPEGNVYVCLDFSDLVQAKNSFEALAQGGKVTMPLQETFWGATFGILTDAFGVRWMFNCNK